MAAPLAPVVNGPIVTTSDKVLVSGALAGANVELKIGGAPVGSSAAPTNGNLWVPLSRTLNAGEMVVAVQTLGGVTSPASNNPVPVLAVPSPLPAPVFASPMSQFMSHVLLAGLVPGAKVEVRNGGTIAGAIGATGTSGWVPVNPAVLAAGAVLSAVQKLGGQTSPTATSNKLVAVNARVVPPPKIAEPVRACDTALHVLDCIPAADLVSDNGGNSSLWTTVATDYWAVGAAEFKPGPLKVFQRLPGAGTQSPDVLLTVEPAVAPGPPGLSPFCPDAKRIAVSGLKPGGVLTLWKRIWDQTAETEIGSIGIGKENEQVDLPEMVGGSGPIMSIVARQTSCGLTSPPNSATEFARPGSGAVPLATPKIVGPLYDCARAVPCESLAMVATRLVSARFGHPLSDWTVPLAPGALLSTWFPLVADDDIRIEQSGCGAPAESAKEPVNRLPAPLPAPTIVPPIRPGATAVTAKGFLSGARAHLMVDWVVRASIDAWRKNEVFHLGSGLGDGAKLWTFQTLCTESSPQEGHPVVVTKGPLSVEVNPSQVSGGVPASIIVNVRDGDDGKVLNGLPVQIGGDAVGLSGTAFNWTPPTTGTSASGVVVGGSAYQNGAFTIAVRQAVPITLGLYAGEGAVPGYAAMSDVEWSASPQWSGGATKKLNAATGSVSIEGSPPSGVVGVSVKLKVQLAADAFYGFDAETIDIPGGLVTNVALTKPSHAVSATLTVGLTTDADEDGEVRYRRFAKVSLLSLI
ncbi:MAG: hypothetical protein ACXWUR_05485 [Allosphingosinicella sp.]